jgi:hypothetical protein
VLQEVCCIFLTKLQHKAAYEQKIKLSKSSMFRSSVDFSIERKCGGGENWMNNFARYRLNITFRSLSPYFLHQAESRAKDLFKLFIADELKNACTQIKWLVAVK